MNITKRTQVSLFMNEREAKMLHTLLSAVRAGDVTEEEELFAENVITRLDSFDQIAEEEPK
jgi:hypothetical protein